MRFLATFLKSRFMTLIAVFRFLRNYYIRCFRKPLFEGLCLSETVYEYEQWWQRAFEYLSLCVSRATARMRGFRRQLAVIACRRLSRAGQFVFDPMARWGLSWWLWLWVRCLTEKGPRLSPSQSVLQWH